MIALSSLWYRSTVDAAVNLCYNRDMDWKKDQPPTFISERIKTSPAARDGIALIVQSIVLRMETHRMDHYTIFLGELWSGSQGYIIAHILRLGGYIDYPS